LKHRKLALILIMAALALTMACFRGGVGTGDATAIPFFTPTVSPQVCENDGYPSDAPQFGDDGGFEYVSKENGVKIFDHVVGDGASPDPTDEVLLQYTGFLTSGCIFDTNQTRVTPTLFPIDGLISGFREGILGMKLGGSRRISIPASEAYRDLGIPGRIPPNSTIIFEVELIEINPGDDDGSVAEPTEEPAQTPSGN